MHFSKLSLNPFCLRALRTSLCGLFLTLLAVCSFANVAFADSMTFSGAITQSTQDGTGPAANNPALNNILDGDSFLVTLTFTGSITAPGLYNITSLTFDDASAGATEASFDPTTLVIIEASGFDQFSLLGCLTTGSGCLFGNQLSANFEIPVGSLNSKGVSTTGLDQPHPLDLLEDDGVTDIQGQISTYSYNGAVAPVPEPSTLALLVCALMVLAAGYGVRRRIETDCAL